MPGPPLCPPPPPPPPAVGTTNRGPTTAAASSNDRSALLKSIQSGTKLKRTVTNDKSAPMIGKVPSNHIVNSTEGGTNCITTVSPNSNNNSNNNGTMNFGDLFAGGMPKLRSVGGVSGGGPTINGVKPRPQPDNAIHSRNATSNTTTTVQNQLKKQLLNSGDNKNRGPPPPAPIRSTPPPLRNGYTPPSLSPQVTPQFSRTMQTVASSLHRKAKSNANLSVVDAGAEVSQPSPPQNNMSASSVNGCKSPLSLVVSKPQIKHGKPNLAPKPPGTTSVATSPRKVLAGVAAAPVNGAKPITRAQSMKNPLNTNSNSQSKVVEMSSSAALKSGTPLKFGTVRNLSTVIGSSLGTAPRRPPLLNGRPSAPPPSIPKGAATVIRPPNHAPPPPPPLQNSPNLNRPSSGVLPPPPPPHRTQVTVSKSLGISGSGNGPTPPPPPPPRHSSISGATTAHQITMNPRPQIDFDERFKHMFHSVNVFPKPPPFRHTLKLYPSKHQGSNC